MKTKSPIKYYLAQSVRTNGKYALLAWVGTLVLCLILVTIRVLPPVYNLIPFLADDIFVFNVPPKLAPFAVPLVLFLRNMMCEQEPKPDTPTEKGLIVFRGASHKAWQEDNPDIPITKKQFATALYLEIFLSTFLGVFALGIIWVVAGLLDSIVFEYIFRNGIHVLGVVFLWVCLATTMFYTLQFSPLKKIANGGLLLFISLLGSLQVAAWLQNNSWPLIDDRGIPIPLVFMVFTLIGLIFLVIGRAITAQLYERVDL